MPMHHSSPTTSTDNIPTSTFMSSIHHPMPKLPAQANYLPPPNSLYQSSQSNHNMSFDSMAPVVCMSMDGRPLPPPLLDSRHSGAPMARQQHRSGSNPHPYQPSPHQSIHRNNGPMQILVSTTNYFALIIT